MSDELVEQDADQLAVDQLGDYYRRHRKMRDRSYVVRLMDQYFETSGGPESIGDLLSGTQVLAKNSESIGMRVTFIRAVRDFVKDYDEVNEKSLDWDAIDPDDLKAIVVSAVTDKIREDPQYAQAIMYESAAADPGLIDGMIKALQKIKRDGVVPERAAIEHIE